MEHNEIPPVEFDFIASELSLDFVNTVNNRRSPAEKEELITSYPILVEWGRQAGLLSDRQVDSLLLNAQRKPDEAEAVVERARALREAIYRMVLASLNIEQIQAADLNLLNAELGRASAYHLLVKREGQYIWEWEYPDSSLDPMLGPVAQSAANLLSSHDLELARECAGDDCGWLFVDRTRNHSRRWCDMKVCGNVAKVRSYRSRKKEATAG